MKVNRLLPIWLAAPCIALVVLSCSGSDVAKADSVGDLGLVDAGFDAQPDTTDAESVEEDLVEVVCGEGVEQIDPRRSPELVEGCTRVLAAIHMPDYYEGDFEIVSSLRHAEKRFSIFRAHSPVDYSAFSKLRTVGGDLLIRHGDPGPDDLRGFDSLESVDGPLIIESNAGLRSLDGLENLRRVGELTIGGNLELTNIDAIHGVVIDGDVRISSNSSLSPQAIDAWIESAEIAGQLVME